MLISFSRNYVKLLEHVKVVDTQVNESDTESDRIG
jgi:hypothetical protein